MSKNIIILTGLPASGKYTIGNELRNLLGFGFIHEHQFMEIAKNLYDGKRSLFIPYTFRLRANITEDFLKIRDSNAPNGFITTLVYLPYSTIYRKMFSAYINLLKQYKSKIIIVNLVASIDIRRERNLNTDRLQLKPSKRDIDKSIAQLEAIESHINLNLFNDFIDREVLDSCVFFEISTENGNPFEIAQKIVSQTMG